MTQATQPLVSIIVPVYNVERYVDECLASIRAQTYPNLEILLVEDCSTDGSLKALEPHLEDPRVRLIRHEQNGGLSAARNTGIEAARGDYVMFVDSDDLVAPALVDTCVSSAVTAGADVVVFDFISFQDGRLIPGESNEVADVCHTTPERNEYFKLPHFAWLKFIRSDLMRDPRLRFPVGFYYEDWPFHWELGFSASRIERIQIHGVEYRLRGDSITGSGGHKLLHTLRSQELVSGVVARHAVGSATRKILAERTINGIWQVLTSVDSKLLPEATSAARAHLLAMEDVLSDVDWHGHKWVIVRTILALPHPVSLSAAHGLRFAVNLISPARRKRHRDLVVADPSKASPIMTAKNPGRGADV